MSIKSVFDRMKAKSPAAIAAQSAVIENHGAHGEIWLERVDDMPEGLEKVMAENGVYILAHSESGHHHIMDADADVELYREDAMTAFLRITGGTPKTLYQKRGSNPHQEQSYAPGIWRIRNAREKDLAGEIRRSMD